MIQVYWGHFGMSVARSYTQNPSVTPDQLALIWVFGFSRYMTQATTQVRARLDT